MMTIKVRFRPPFRGAQEGSLYYQVGYGRDKRQVETGYRLRPDEWDAEAVRPVALPGTDATRLDYLRRVACHVSKDLRRLAAIATEIEAAKGRVTTAEVIMRFDVAPVESGFLAFARSLMMRLREEGRVRTVDAYSASVNSLARFLMGRDVALRDVDAELMVHYEKYLCAMRICPNSSSYYMRNLRAIYNRAVEERLVEQQYPFRRVYTGVGRTVKRAVPLDVIRQIRDLDLGRDGRAAFARDMFMFSFYMRGMSFVDMAYLRKADLRQGAVFYRRRKTGQCLRVKWEREMERIVARYDNPDSPYLLPIIRREGCNEHQQYLSAAHLVNNKLKKIGQTLGLSIPLTTYVARHGWASIAHSKDVPLATISEAMGHDSERTTRIYLATLDSNIVDKANSIVLRSL